MRKKLLIATDSFLPRWDGIARFLAEIIPKLQDDYDITVMAPKFPGTAPLPAGIRLVRFDLMKRFTVGDYRPAWPKWRILRQEVKNADIVFSQTIGPIGVFSVFEARRQKKPIIAYIHSIEWELSTYSISPKMGRSILYNGSKLLARFIYNRADLLLVPSREIGDFITHAGIRTQKKVLGMGIDVEKFAPGDKEAAKKAIGLDPSAPVIGFVGRLGREKDLSTLQRAFMRVHKHFPQAQLLVVGEGLPQIKAMFQGKPGVHVVGYKDDTVPFYQAMDIYALPSLTETTSLSTLEAMACGVPVICTPVGYVQVYVRPGVNGYLFPRKNSFALTHRLRDLLANPKLRAEMGQNARKTVVSNFSWDKRIKDLKQVLELF